MATKASLKKRQEEAAARRGAVELPATITKDAVTERFARADADINGIRLGHGSNAVQEFPIALIDLNPYNARTYYDPASLDQLGLSMEKNKQQQPVKIALKGDGRGTLIFGHRRLKSLQSRGKTSISAIVLTGAEAEAALEPENLFIASQIENEEREPNTSYDNAVSYKKALDDGIFRTQVDLARRLGIAESELSRVLAFHNLPDEIKRVIADNPKSFGARMFSLLAQLYKLDPNKALERIHALAEAGDHPDGYRNIEKDIKDARLGLDDPLKTKVRKEFSNSLNVHIANRPIGTFKTFPDGRIDIRIKIEDEETQNLLAAAIKEVLAGRGATMTQRKRDS